MRTTDLPPRLRRMASTFVALFVALGLLLAQGLWADLKAKDLSFARKPLAREESATGPLKLVGQLGGITNAIGFSGPYLYMGLGARLAVYDVSDPANPRELQNGSDLPGIVRDLQVAGQYLYVAVDTEGLLIFDLANPRDPVRVGHLTLENSVTSYANGVIVSGSLAFVRGRSVALINIASPSSPQLVSEIPLRSWGPLEFALDGARLWVTYPGYSSGFVDVVDVSNMLQPTLIATSSSTDFRGAIRVDNGIAIFSHHGGGIGLYDAVNLDLETPLAFIPTPKSPSSVSIVGKYLFVTNSSSGGLQVIDMDNPRQPAIVHSVEDPLWSGTKTIVRGNLLYLINPWRGVRIVDIANPVELIERGMITASFSANNITVVGTDLLVADGTHSNSGFVAINLSDPVFPRARGRYYQEDLASVVSISMAGDVAYLVSNYSLIDIVAIQDIDKPVKIGTFRSFWNHSASSMAAGQLLIGAFSTQSGSAGMLAFDVSRPLSPTQVSMVELPGIPFSFELRNGLAYVAMWTGGLQIADISDPATPKYLGGISGIGQIDSVAVRGDYAYLGAMSTSDPLFVIDTTNPAHPIQANRLTTSVGTVTTDDKFLYLHTRVGIDIFDLTSPVAPSLVASSSELPEVIDYSPYTRVALKVIGQYIVVPHQDAGLYIYEFSPDNQAPTGELLAPGNDAVLVPDTDITLFARASDGIDGSGIKRVQFYAFYDGAWHHLADDTIPPYETTWHIPGTIQEQPLRIGLHIEDHWGNYAIDPVEPVSAQIVTAGKMLNARYADQVFIQQTMEGGYWNYCGATSVAMFMNYIGTESRDVLYDRQATLDLVCDTKVAADCTGGTSLEKLRETLAKRGVGTIYRFNPTFDELRYSIDLGVPVLLSLAEASHIVLVTGYTPTGDIIVNDPFGAFQWWKSAYPGRRNVPYSQESPKFKGYHVDYAYDAEMSGKYGIFAVGSLQARDALSATLGTSGGEISFENIRVQIPGLGSRSENEPGTSYTISYRTAYETSEPLPASMLLVHDFAITAADFLGNSIHTWQSPIGIQMTVDPTIVDAWRSSDGLSTPVDPLEAPHQSEVEFAIVTWSPATKSWVELPSIFEPASNLLSASHDEFTEFALVLRPSVSQDASSLLHLPLLSKP